MVYFTAMTTLRYTDIQQGVFFRMDGAVYETVDSVFSKKSRQKGSNQVRIRHVATGAVTTKTLHASDAFEEVTLQKEPYTFVYADKGRATVHPADNPSGRVSVPIAHPGINLIPSGTPITALTENGDIMTFQLPIKVDLRVTESPPGVRGNTAQGGTKRVTVETGATVTTPLFIETGDYIRVNTETGEYTERAKK